MEMVVKTETAEKSNEDYVRQIGMRQNKHMPGGNDDTACKEHVIPEDLTASLNR